MIGDEPAPGDRPNNRPLWILVAATALCYAVGYPLALIGNSTRWVIWSRLGGPLLVAARLAGHPAHP